MTEKSIHGFPTQVVTISALSEFETAGETLEDLPYDSLDTGTQIATYKLVKVEEVIGDPTIPTKVLFPKKSKSKEKKK